MRTKLNIVISKATTPTTVPMIVSFPELGPPFPGPPPGTDEEVVSLFVLEEDGVVGGNGSAVGDGDVVGSDDVFDTSGGSLLLVDEAEDEETE